MSKSDGTNGFRLQPRDEKILRGLLDGRIMTIKQTASLYFDGRFDAAKKRLQKLEAAGFIAKRARRVQDPALYSLTRKGYMSLKEDGMLDPLLELGWARMQDRINVSEMMLRHEVAVMDVKAALAPAIESAQDLELAEFTVNPERHAFQVSKAILDSKKLVGFRSVRAKADGFIHVKETRLGGLVFDHRFFLEVDRGTESLTRIVKKAGQYSQYYRNGGFATKLGHAREHFKRHPFRVLLIVQCAERRNNIAEKLLKMKTPVRSMIWITAREELLANPLGAIWVRPSDYQEATRGSEFDAASKPSRGVYRRQVGRETWIEARVQKNALLPTKLAA